MGSAQVKQSKSNIITVPVDNRGDIKQGIETEVSGTNDDVTSTPDEAEQEGNTSDDSSTTEGTDTEDDEFEETLLELTPEQMETYQDKRIANLQELIKEAQNKDSYTGKEEEYNFNVEAVVMTFASLYSEMDSTMNVPLAVLTNFRKRVAAVAIQTKTLEIICDIVKTTTQENYHRLKISLGTLQNYSDASSDFAIAVAHNPGFCEKIKEILRDRFEEHTYQSHYRVDLDLTELCVGVVHNLSMLESNIGRLRQVGYIPLLKSYLATPKEMFRLSVFSTLAAIINEEESEIIKANIDVVRLLLTYLSRASSKHLHRYNGWSCKESTLTVRMLARNDANKKLLVELGALELLVKMGKIGDHDEQYEAVSALWALSFDLDNRKKMCNEDTLGVVDLFIELKDSEENRIRKVCEGALWTLRDDLKDSSVEKYKSHAESASPGQTQPIRGKSREFDGHVMISYQWADQKTLIKIRDQLKNAGMKVWIDIDQMGGSTIEAMARAVEQATVVLMCMSQKYKDSQNCRAEAEYAFQKQKTIVPLKMEQGYTPDGWLGFICGSKVFFEFSGKYRFEDKMSHLLKELAAIFQTTGKRGEDVLIPVQAHPVTTVIRYADEVDSGPQVASGVPVTMALPADPNFTKTIKTVREWTSEDVKTWIEKNNLKSCGVDSLTGSEVALLMRMNQQAPECFFNCLQDPKKMKRLLNMSKITWALDNLTDRH